MKMRKGKRKILFVGCANPLRICYFQYIGTHRPVYRGRIFSHKDSHTKIVTVLLGSALDIQEKTRT